MIKHFFVGWKEGMRDYGITLGLPLNCALLCVAYFVGVGLSKLLKKKEDDVKGWRSCDEEQNYYRQF